MRLHCHVCGKVQVFAAISNNSIACHKCGHKQPIKGVKTVPRKAKPKEGSLTGSEKFVKSKSLGELAASAISGLAQSTIETGNASARVATNTANGLSSVAQSISGGINTTKTTVSNITGHNGLGGYLSPDSVAHGVPLAKFDLTSALGADLFSSESSIPEMGILDATQHRTKIARQANALDVGIAKTQRDRKAVKLATELRLLQGDAIDYHTIAINNSTKAVRNQAADRDYHIETSKLEEKDALLTQQRIKTNGTQALTPLIAEHWQLKIRQQEAANQSLAVDIEKGFAEIDTKRIELEARLIEASAL